MECSSTSTITQMGIASTNSVPYAKNKFTQRSTVDKAPQGKVSLVYK